MSSVHLSHTWSKAEELSLRYTFGVTLLMVSGYQEDVFYCG